MVTHTWDNIFWKIAQMIRAPKYLDYNKGITTANGWLWLQVWCNVNLHHPKEKYRLAHKSVNCLVKRTYLTYLKMYLLPTKERWLRHYAISRKVFEFKLDHLIFSIELFFSSRNMTLWSTQSLTEMCIRNFPRNKARPACNVDNLIVIYKSIVWNMWEPRRLTSLLPSTASYKDSLTFIFCRTEIEVI
jgi:hypothetical protein